MLSEAGGLLSFGSCPWSKEAGFAELTSALAVTIRSELLVRALAIAFLSAASAWLVRNTDLGRRWASKIVPCLQTMGAFALLGALMTIVLGLPLGQLPPLSNCQSLSAEVHEIAALLNDSMLQVHHILHTKESSILARPCTT